MPSQQQYSGSSSLSRRPRLPALPTRNRVRLRGHDQEWRTTLLPQSGQDCSSRVVTPGKNYTAKLVTRLLPMAPLLLDLRKGKMWSPFYLPTESKAAHVLNFPGAIFVPALSASSQWTAGAKYNKWLIFGCDNLQRRNMVGSLRVNNLRYLCCSTAVF